MAQRFFSHQMITGLPFGLTTAVINSLGLIVGLWSATFSKLAVVAGIIIMAIADGLSDAISLYVAEEAEVEKDYNPPSTLPSSLHSEWAPKAKHTSKEIWLTTLFTFLFISGFTLTFAIPILIFPLETAIFVAIGWGIFFINLS